jgi:hypothetical protein
MKTKKISMVFALTCLAVFFLAFPIFGDEDSPSTGHRYDQQESRQKSNSPEGGGQRREPPQEAINACDGKSAGDKVEFETPRGETVTGTCVNNGELTFAIPEGGHQPPRGGNQQQKRR